MNAQEKAVVEVKEYLSREPDDGIQVSMLYYAWTAGVSKKWECENRRVEQPGGKESWYKACREIFTPSGEEGAFLASEAHKEKQAWDAAKKVAAYSLKERGAVPEDLRGIASSALSGDKGPTKKPRNKHLGRDLYIANAVLMLVNAGFDQYRNDASTGLHSACGIVADIKCMGYDSVVKIWGRLESHVRAVEEHGPYYFLKDGQALKFDL